MPKKTSDVGLNKLYGNPPPLSDKLISQLQGAVMHARHNRLMTSQFNNALEEVPRIESEPTDEETSTVSSSHASFR